MSILLGVNLGPSFAEYCLIDTTRPKLPIGFKRVYTPNVSIADSLMTFLIQNQNQKPTQAIIASRMLEKILDTKLGGSVAQIVTKGFENWPLLRQGLKKPYFEITPQRTEPLASQDLIFGINERISAKGEVLRPLDLQELEFIHSKLKMMNLERVCINLLFAHKNNSHLQMAERFFVENGYEVYSTKENTKIMDEIFNWRKNILNASLSGTFKEIQTAVLQGCRDHIAEDQIFFLDGDAQLFHKDVQRISSSLFGAAQALAQFYSDYDQVLVLGMDKWFLLRPHEFQDTWQSPWGPLAGRVPVIENLRIQPTTEIVVDEFHNFGLGQEVLGYEPGPMLFGKAFRPTLFDVINAEKPIDEFIPFINESAAKKLNDQLKAMMKHSNFDSPRKMSSSQDVVQSLVDDIVDQIAIQISLEKVGDKKPIICTGVFSTRVFDSLKQRWPEIPWQLCPYSREIEGLSVTNAGMGSNL